MGDWPSRTSGHLDDDFNYVGAMAWWGATDGASVSGARPLKTLCELYEAASPAVVLMV